MRLINAKTLELHDFYLSEVPRYAILSHTWGDGEVSFREMSSPNRSSKDGFSKIRRACSLALAHSLEFVWVDTCSIDKSSSAELTESINSMFQWYRNAVVCYVFLWDLPTDISTEVGLPSCSWFTRGWTLQELLAPKKVEFYDEAWNHRGSKRNFIPMISNITGIPSRVLRKYSDTVETCSVATRMSWAAQRRTTRVEDMAYCLLGIFNVNMPLIYGEGLKSFRRLQEEIIKRNNDLTIFAWDTSDRVSRYFGLFAPYPAAFAGSSGIQPFFDDFPDFSATNKGLLVSGDIPLRTAEVLTEDGDKISRYLLFLGTNAEANATDGGIYLRKIGPGLFCRDGKLPLAGYGKNLVDQIDLFDVGDYYIIIDPTMANAVHSTKFREYAVHIPLDDTFRLEDTVPEALWDLTDRVFLRPKPYRWVRYPMVIAMAFRGTFANKFFRFIVLCDYRDETPICKAFEAHNHPGLVEMIFRGRYRSESIFWADLEIQAPRLSALDDNLEVRAGDTSYTISFFFEKEMVQHISGDTELFSLKFAIKSRPDNTRLRNHEVQ